MAPHRARPREVHAVCQALPHLVTEEADADTLQVLRGDLQGQGHQVKATPTGSQVCYRSQVSSSRTSTTSASPAEGLMQRPC